NASAAQTAAMLNGIPGVSANAFTTATITGIDIHPSDFTIPLQITLNNEKLLPVNALDFSENVPDPNADQFAFNDYLAQQINSNPNLNTLGIRAVSGANPDGDAEIRLVASSGTNLEVRFAAS